MAKEHLNKAGLTLRTMRGSLTSLPDIYDWSAVCSGERNIIHLYRQDHMFSTSDDTSPKVQVS